MTLSLRILLLTTLLLSACQQAPEHPNESQEAEPDAHAHSASDTPDAHEDEDEHGHARVRLTAGQLSYFGVTVGEAAAGAIDLGILLPGEIRPNGDRLAHIVPRFPGIVKEVFRTVGDAVRPDEVLAVIESSQSLTPYELKTLIGGTILEKHLTRGEAVQNDKQVYIVADLSTVWVDLSVYQKDLAQIRIGQDVHISGGPGLPETTGRISYVTPIVDQPTRTATARVVLPNTSGQWRPGMFVTAHVVDPTPAAVVVPRTALQTVERETVVFVQEDDAFEPRPVSIGRAGERHVEVLQGLSPGDRFVTTNAFLLKAELGKSEAEHEH